MKACVTSQLRRWQRYNKVQQVAEVDVYVYGLQINRAMNIVRLNDIDFTLTQKEFALLKVLAAKCRTNIYKGAIVSPCMATIKLYGYENYSIKGYMNLNKIIVPLHIKYLFM